MRTDVDVLFIGGPMDSIEYPIEKRVGKDGVARPPRSIPVGSFNLGPLLFPTIEPEPEAHPDLVAVGEPMIGTGPLAGKYMPEGISDNGRRAYVWHDHG